MDRAQYFRSCANTLVGDLARTYGIPVIIYDVLDPFTGDLDGQDIHIDYLVKDEDRLFLIAHLFGHTVQWAMKPETRRIGHDVSIPVPEQDLPPLLNYEREAAQYALQLMHANGIKDLDGWFTDYSACDLEYLAHFYRTGEKKEPSSFWKDSVSPLIVPQPIPADFKPEKWIKRVNSGIII